MQTIGVYGVPDDFNTSVITNAFSNSHQVVGTATSSISGVVFEYALDVADGGEFSTSGIFDNVLPGIHYVSITDEEVCRTYTVAVKLIDYPHFFTPNCDGINDTWAIIGQEGIPIYQIYIFDRFGKLLKQLNPERKVWE
ncbi:MAG: T9SS type B sorting domain-containing protein [Flavobacteriaceae bacterium]|nr:T9SS type B sorting domain-containing protein [Flavobacteriaceae bacterium]